MLLFWVRLRGLLDGWQDWNYAFLRILVMPMFSLFLR
jgi:hypothetical protein